MSEINEFARDLVKRQIEIYKEHKSEKYDMTQPLTVLICCAIIIFSDYKEKYSGDSLIKGIKEKDKDGKLINFINEIYNNNIETRLRFYKRRKENKDKNINIDEKEENLPLNEELKEYEVFFHDLRNEFAHIIETRHSKLTPNFDDDFNKVNISNYKTSTELTKEQINTIIELICGLI